MKIIGGAVTAVSVVVLGSVAWLNSKTKQEIKLSEQRMEKKMDSLNAKMDSQNATLNSKMYSLNAILNSKMDSILQNLNCMFMYVLTLEFLSEQVTDSKLADKVSLAIEQHVKDEQARLIKHEEHIKMQKSPLAIVFPPIIFATKQSPKSRILFISLFIKLLLLNLFFRTLRSELAILF
jgi:hypothetical protein